METYKNIRKWLFGLVLTGFGMGCIAIAELSWLIWGIAFALTMVSIIGCCWRITNILEKLETQSDTD